MKKYMKGDFFPFFLSPGYLETFVHPQTRNIDCNNFFQGALNAYFSFLYEDSCKFFTFKFENCIVNSVLN